MTRYILATATAAVALTAGPAFADCIERIDSVKAEYGEFIDMERTANPATRPILRNLRNAAIRLNQQGNQEGCEAVIDAMQEVVEGMQTARAESGTDSSAEPADSIRTMRDDSKMEDPEYVDGLRQEIEARVTKVESANVIMDTSELVGINVYNYRDDSLGEVDGLLVETGKAPTHIIVGHGGFWNIGDDEAAIPVSKFMWDPEWEVFYLDMTEEQLENAPDYDLKSGEWTVDMNDGYYSKLTQ